MRWIVGSSLRFRYLVVAAAGALVLYGAGQLRDSPVDVFPEFAPPLVEIQTPALGLSPAEVIMVGDTLNADVLGAHNAGMRGVWIDRGPVSPWSNNEASKAHIQPDATLQRLGP